MLRWFCSCITAKSEIVVMNNSKSFLKRYDFRSSSRYVCMYCSYLSSLYEKANCIAIFLTGRPHSLGSCHFRGVWATCLPHKGGGVPLSALPKDTTSELAGLFSTTSHKCRAPSREAVDTIFLKSFGMNEPRPTDCEADALTTTLS